MLTKGMNSMGSKAMQRTVERAYKAGRYTLTDLRELVKADIITAEQFQEITGIDYNLEEVG